MIKVISIRTFPWETHACGDGQVHTAGFLKGLKEISEAAQAGSLSRLCSLLKQEPGTFGLIVETPDHVIAATDRVRGYPVYVRRRAGRIEIAPQTAAWTVAENAGEFDETRVGAFLAAGYSIGEDTLFSSVRRLLPGETMIADRATGKIRYSRYYQFKPRFDAPDAEPEFWEEKLEAALDAATMRVIEQADGAKIWLPLSAGYDSRIVLAKLLSKGYDCIEAFSYGSPGNMESAVACELAKSVGVPWRHINSHPRQPEVAFRSRDVTDYYFSGGGLGTVPAMAEYFPVRNMLSEGCMSEGDFIINGQTGDYLTGAHIPPVKCHEDVAEFILHKHFSLLQSEKDEIRVKGAKEILQRWISQYCSQEIQMAQSEISAISTYLAFEWQERQCQYVVQQQRLYDHFGLRWALPLWDGALMDVYEAAPLREHRNQALYLRYLRRWNYKGMFDEGRRPYDPWPKYGHLIRTVGRVSGLLGGRAAKQRAYKFLYYWGDRHYLYALFGARAHRAFIDEIRSPISLFALDYLARLRKRLGLRSRRPAELAYSRFDRGE